MGERVFSGLAHFIKGGVFFWYGVLTLGRWAGSFADIGWVSWLRFSDEKLLRFLGLEYQSIKIKSTIC